MAWDAGIQLQLDVLVWRLQSVKHTKISANSFKNPNQRMTTNVSAHAGFPTVLIFWTLRLGLHC